MPIAKPRALTAAGIATILIAATVFAVTAGATQEGLAADAGADRTIECTSPAGAQVTLDAGGSHAAHDNDTLARFEWFEDYNASSQRLLGTGATLVVVFPLGTHEVTLRVTNGTNETALDNVTITVVDTTAPTLVATPSRDTLWPPNHRFVPVEVAVSVSDACSASTSFVLENVTSDESVNGRGDGNTDPDIADAQLGTPDTLVKLRSERAGPGDGRIYTLVYSATDGEGNRAEALVHVRVPHDEGNHSA